jgi:Predicted O-methyltransferase
MLFDMDRIKADKISETLTVYQKDTVFSFGTDAVLLAAFVRRFFKNPNGKTGIDLCSGTGIIPFLLLDKTQILRYHAMEINKEAVSLSQMSAEESGFSERFFPICDNLTNVKTHFPAESMDFLTCNPPYLTAGCGKLCEDDYKTIARHEIHCTLSDIFKSAFYLLKTGGTAYFVYRPERLSTLFSAAKESRFELKNMTFVHSKINEPPILVLCEAKKDASETIKITKPFMIYKDGCYSEQMKNTTESGILSL